MDYSKKSEKKNLQQSRNSLSQLLFLWIVPYLYKGSFKDGLNEKDDITKCRRKDQSDGLGSKLEEEWQKERNRASKKNRKPRLRTALFNTFYKDSLIDGISVFLFALLKSIMPLILGQLLVTFQNNTAKKLNATSTDNFTLSEDLVDYDSDQNATEIERESENDFWFFMNHVWNDQVWLSCILVATVLTACFLYHHSFVRLMMLGAQMRIACCSAIYRKTLRLSKKTTNEITGGYVVNLMSNDVNRLDYSLIFVHFIWIMPFQAIFIYYLIYQETKYAAMVGVIGLLLKTIPVQTGLSKLSSIFRMKIAKKTDKRIGIMNELIQGIQVIKMYAWEEPFRKVVKLARKKEVNMIRYASFIRGVLLSTMVFIERSTLFIAIVACVLEGRDITPNVVFSMAQYFNVLQLTAAIIYPMAMSFGAEALVSIKRVEEYLLLEEQEKSSLALHHNEVELVDPESNAIEINNVSASWSNNSKHKTLDNINVKIKAGKLYAIIGQVGSGKSSLLNLLLGELPITSGNVIVNGDLSYASQEAFIFNTSVRNNILFGLPYDKQRYKDTIKYCALLTDFQMLPEGDKTVVGDRGASLSGGQKARVNLARAVYRHSHIILLDDPLSAVDAHVGKFLFEECINGYLAKQKTTRILVTHQVHLLKEVDRIIVFDNGRLLKQGTYNEIMESDVIAPLLNEQTEEEFDENEEYEDIPYIDDAENVLIKRTGSKISKIKRPTSTTSLVSAVSNEEDRGRQLAEDQSQTSIPFSVWREYFLSGAGYFFLFLTFLFLIASQGVVSGSDYFITFWTNQEYLRTLNETTVFSTWDGIYYYGIIVAMVMFVTIFRCILFFSICMIASKVLHNKMFASLMAAEMKFFDQNPTGRILNRFSKDMGAIDEQLPRAMMDSIQNMLVMVGILTMIGIVNPLLLIPLAVAVVLFSMCLKLYLRPAQDLKRLEGIKKSPVFSHLGATLNGISTIRASKITPRVTNEFDQLQDVHSSVYHLMVSSNEALGLWLDIISSSFIAAVTFSFLYLNDETASLVGLAVSQSLILTGMVQHGIRMSTESIQQMTSVERVLAYTKLKPEPSPKKKATQDWPWKAMIEFRNMSLYYDIDGEPVLKNLNFIIDPAMKVGIVGRTGAGKSSLIGALFRLAPIRGDILIDGVNTADISLGSLRSKISIIPQDPVLFSATIRYNLDPFDDHTDESIWKALESVELKEMINGLQFMVTEGGSNFSVGQRQLICLARAILRSNKILVLDEATANVDPATDELIQMTIRKNFKECTVITVAHRLHTIMDSDRVLVMDAGVAKEYDIPHRLLQNPDGLLRNMVEATGVHEAENLYKIAREKFKFMFPDLP